MIAAFDDQQNCSNRHASSTTAINQVYSSALLDLTLRRCQPSGHVHQFIDERHVLNHSAASAFSWYVNKTWQSLPSPANICSQQKDTEELNLENRDRIENSQKSKYNAAVEQPREAKANLKYPQQTRVSVPVPVRGLRFERLCTPYGSPPICRQSDKQTLQSSTSACNEEPSSAQASIFRPSPNPETGSSPKFHNTIDQSTNNSMNVREATQRLMSELSENQMQLSSATVPSATNSVGHGTSHASSMECISKVNIDRVSAV